MTDQPPYFTNHVFVCGNRRPDDHPRGSCAAKGSEKLRDYMKARAKELGLAGVRINAAGCLDRCEHGPTMVIYPRGTWYRIPDRDAVDRVLIEDIRDGNPIAELMLPAEIAQAK
ncbi:(2Fe-2S) ferredoxin domain-containing protein [Acidiphilium sp. AL]|uniref:(2Fe-2S) ferredoxin domain-containing protein n=1 Tax=Acidiphilium iwatense TaxID=768198 RepID=A0ABS9DX12_9PROT|nr:MULTISPECIES: (2Fe-2S) ferredoxin domain-containing protein [Acidiphilium]MCF3946345.1 (2Fe-2S) ferredoxin domain-containing protein [Acidiphilium iwatense]MCU4159871.1 (2Fe-2S) ferredoxin domain-containing protein [Acidiphilium sp. AL]